MITRLFTLASRLAIWRRRGHSLRTALRLAWVAPLYPAIAGGVGEVTTTQLAADFVTYIADKTLLLAQKIVRMKQLGEKVTLPRRNSKTWQYTRYERLALPQSTISEGVTPANTQMTITTVTATVQQWGQVVTLTDLTELVVKHPVLQKGLELLALAAAETVDREIQKVLLAGTNVQYVGGGASRASIGAGNVLVTNEVRKTLANLRNNGARGFDSDTYVGVIDPSVEQDITADAAFLQASQYSNIKALFNGEIGKWMGVRWLRSNILHIFTGNAAAGYTLGTATVGGSIPTATTVFVVVTGVDNNTGYETQLYQQSSQATGAGNTGVITVVVPVTTGFTYNVYAGTTTGTTFQVTTGVAPGATYTITSVPTSGTTNPPIPATGISAHVVWVAGQQAFSYIELDGMSLQTYVTPKGPIDSDPLAQRRRIGWKLAFQAVINNQNFVRRVECASAY